MTTISTSTKQSRSYPFVASDGTVCVVFWDGSNIVFSTATSPYSSWSGTTTIVTSPGLSGLSGTAPGFGGYIDSSDSIYVGYSNSANAYPAVRKLTKSGSTWTVGSENVVVASVMFGIGLHIIQEPGGSRLWLAFLDNAASLHAYYSDNSGTSWSAGTSMTVPTSSGNPNNDWIIGVASGSGSTYIVLAAADDGPVIYTRHLTTNSGSTWSSSTTAGSYTVWADHSGWWSATDGAGRLLVMASPGNGNDYAIRTFTYTSTSDTWSTNTDIGLATTDRWPFAVSDGTNIWCIWSAFSASNNYSIVYKKWTNGSATWDASATTLVSSGANNDFPGAWYGASLIAASYTTGTANPWNVNFASVSFGASTTTYTFTEALTISDSVIVGRGYVPTDGLTASDSLSGSSIGLLNEGLSVADSVLVQDGYNTTDGLTALDAFLSQDGATWIEIGTVSDSFSSGGSYLPIEALSIADSLLSGNGYTTIDALSAANLQSALQSWPVDALNTSDSLTAGVVYLPVDALSGADPFLVLDQAMWADVLTIADSATFVVSTPAVIRPGIATLSDGLHGAASISDGLVNQATANDVEVGSVAISDQG